MIRTLTIEAMQFDGRNAEEVARWLGRDVVCEQITDSPIIFRFRGDKSRIPLAAGDWVGKLPNGTFAEVDRDLID